MTFLHYALVERVLEGQLTAYQISTTSVYLILGPNQVLYFPQEHNFDPAAYPGAWALVDSNAALVEPREEFISLKSSVG
jgi:hypothetical protein